MNDAPLDPALIGIWLLPGQPQTYEITEDGKYHFAEPEEPVNFSEDGATMIWGGRVYHRSGTGGETPVGTWREHDTGDGWDFTEDHGLTILTADPGQDRAFVGIWALRDDGQSLWVRETHANLETDGAHLTYHMSTGEVFRYGYSVSNGILTLMDPETWAELTRYVSATRLQQSFATG
ncbi:hypothetical protein [Hasllibacter sp. MH4015]|uniref:hypothetical protein n=1 Tax=Hasllibacter sp. MH4015 TaxID=2854029 RepID=UPI001CD74B5F|nr:hypothetical protein [Hasllibacter sp. MH4015]